MGDYTTDFITNEIERKVTKWYCAFTEYWTVSVAVDAENPAGEARYSLRVVGPNGEAAKETQLDPEDVPIEVRERFRDIYYDAVEKV